MAAQVSILVQKHVLRSVKVECVFISFSGDGKPAEPGVPQGGGLSIPVGVPLLTEHNTHSLQLLGTAP